GDFGRHDVGALLGCVAKDEAERFIALRWVDGKSIALLILERVVPAGSLVHVLADIVHKREERRHGSKTSSDRPPYVAIGSQPFEIPRRFAQDLYVGVPEGVNGLLAVADDED